MSMADQIADQILFRQELITAAINTLVTSLGVAQNEGVISDGERMYALEWLQKQIK